MPKASVLNDTSTTRPTSGASAKAEKRREQNRLAAQRYRERNREAYNERAKVRVARTRAKPNLSEYRKEWLKTSKRVSAARYYERHQKAIGFRAKMKNARKYIETHGIDAYHNKYKFRKGNPWSMLPNKKSEGVTVDKS